MIFLIWINQVWSYLKSLNWSQYFCPLTLWTLLSKLRDDGSLHMEGIFLEPCQRGLWVRAYSPQTGTPESHLFIPIHHLQKAAGRSPSAILARVRVTWSKVKDEPHLRRLVYAFKRIVFSSCPHTHGPFVESFHFTNKPVFLLPPVNLCLTPLSSEAFVSC